MIRIHFTRKENLHELAKRLLSDEPGQPVNVSLSYSGKKGVVAISENPVGVGLKYVKDRNYPSVLSRFSAREKAEITSREEFIKHWTAKEAFIKMQGYALVSALKFTEYFGGRIYFKDEKQPCEITHYKLGKTGILTICK